MASCELFVVLCVLVSVGNKSRLRFFASSSSTAPATGKKLAFKAVERRAAVRFDAEHRRDLECGGASLKSVA